MDQKNKITNYHPRPALKNPIILFKQMKNDLFLSKELAWRLFIRNISAMYRQTYLGYFWAFLPPIANTLIWVFLNSNNIVDVGESSIPYPVFVMIGTLLWQIFLDAINSPLKLVTSSKSMLIKINFPRESLILAGILEILFNFLIRLVLFIFILFWFEVNIPSSVFLAPIGIIAIIMLGLTFGILLTPLGVLYQDISKGITIITSIWFFLTPVVYPMPNSYPANLIAKYNPISPLLVVTRDWITIGSVNNLDGFLIVSFLSMIFIFFGWILFKISMPHVISRVGA